MLLQLIASTVLAAPLAPAAPDHGKLPWFEGTYAELLAKASAENRVVFLDFWTDW